jgi:hypothetical protein
MYSLIVKVTGQHQSLKRFVRHWKQYWSIRVCSTAGLLGYNLLQIRLDVKANREENIQQVMDLMSAPTLDQHRALAMVEAKTDALERRAPEVLAAVANFTNRLTPDQKQEMRTRFEHKMEKRRRPGESRITD